jgi:hypothetical protein
VGKLVDNLVPHLGVDAKHLAPAPCCRRKPPPVLPLKDEDLRLASGGELAGMVNRARRIGDGGNSRIFAWRRVRFSHRQNIG